MTATPTTEIIDITPEQADQWLRDHYQTLDEGTFKQRPVDHGRVAQYASDMFMDNWMLNHQGIAFSDQGNLLDGQHRLQAIKVSGCTVRMMVTRGLPQEYRNGTLKTTLDTIDVGRTRSISQQLSLSHGVKGSDAAYVSSICKRIIEFATGKSLWQVSVAQAVMVNQLFGPAIAHILRLSHKVKHKHSALLAPLCLYAAGKPEKAEAFAKSFYRLENLSADSPVLTLVRWLDKNRNTKPTPARFMLVVCNCLWFYDQGKPITNFQPVNQAFEWLYNSQKESLDKVRSMLNQQ